MSKWKGVILAGGTGSRLQPLTYAINKHLLPVYDKPMIFYPLTTLMFAGIRDFVIVTTPSSVDMFRAVLGNGAQWGISIDYRLQEKAAGVADGLKIAVKDASAHIALILGDNIFYGSGLGTILKNSIAQNRGATIFSYEVANPSAFGVVTLDAHGTPISLEEKPANPTSRQAVTGLYLYGPDVIEIVKSLEPSRRGELEITDLNRAYLNKGVLSVQPLGRGIAWLDGGTCGDLFEASQFVKIIEDRTGLKISCPEEVALRLDLINRTQFTHLVASMPECSYKTYLSTLQ